MLSTDQYCCHELLLPAIRDFKAWTEDVDESTVLVATCVAKGHIQTLQAARLSDRMGLSQVPTEVCSKPDVPVFTHATKARICTGAPDALSQTCFPTNGLPLLD